ncbi:MAG: ATP-binding cassette domain-containing protein [Peptococcaceae bacterium]|jgi:ABC-2 type transport system ATP-binding protein|nr:ATP-binding cassette domain-containing protein [Peptococcaceae bacterium]
MSAPERRTVLSVRRLTKEYVTHERRGALAATLKSLFVRKKITVRAVNNVSFDVAQGDIVGLIGENGAGKSTIIKILTGVLFPTGGEVKVLDFVPYRDRSRYVAHIGAVFGQKSQLIWDIPPMDAFRLNKAIYAIPDSAYAERLERMTALLGLERVVGRPVRTLSLGERMKCEFVMAMLHRPRMVFLDEPTIGVDLLAKENIHAFIREMNRDGVTFILTTHDLEDIEQLAHRVVILNKGEKVFEDELAVLKRYLGDKKTIRVTTKGPLPPAGEFLRPGVALFESVSEKEVVLEVNGAILPMSEFLARLWEFGQVQNISIQEIGIAEVIKAIYQEHA